MYYNKEKLNSIIKDISGSYYKLLMIVGKFNSGKTKLLKQIAAEYGFKYLNFNLEVSESLLTLTNKERNIFDYFNLFQVYIEDESIKTLIFDNIEIIFHPKIKRDPLQLFKHLSRNKLCIISWPGTIDAGKIHYAEPNNKEYYEESLNGVQYIQLS